MPKFIVETLFDVQASDEDQAKFIVESVLKMAEIGGWSIPEFHVTGAEERPEKVRVIRRIGEIFPKRGAA